jgi:hypothetical protein
LVDWLRDFGTGWQGLLVVCLILFAWVLRGYLPARYKAKIAYKKYLLGHQERMKKLENAATKRAGKKSPKRGEPDA